ncbi:major allergen Pru ar 1-like [Coffea eugenioides]|uniref:major allergen Pru ar 1-like n=1 Tax=Coffea eugenioides TaxID=49369 RepID=UPI000F607A46|nr:major allergen Pru ar 1-like [Coffea eugenioides]
MAATTFSHEYTYTIPPARLFKASVLDSHNLFPKLLPQAFKSIEILRGNGGSGSIKQINLGDGKTLSFLKYHIDELNEETYTYSYTLIEGDALSDKLEKITYEVKFEPTANGGTISKMTSKYYPKGDYVVNEEEVMAGKEKASGMYKAVEAFLLQNPEAYA